MLAAELTSCARWLKVSQQDLMGECALCYQLSAERFVFCRPGAAAAEAITQLKAEKLQYRESHTEMRALKTELEYLSRKVCVPVAVAVAVAVTVAVAVAVAVAVPYLSLPCAQPAAERLVHR